MYWANVGWSNRISARPREGAALDHHARNRNIAFRHRRLPSLPDPTGVRRPSAPGPPLPAHRSRHRLAEAPHARHREAPSAAVPALLIRRKNLHDRLPERLPVHRCYRRRPRRGPTSARFSSRVVISCGGRKTVASDCHALSARLRSDLLQTAAALSSSTTQSTPCTRSPFFAATLRSRASPVSSIPG